MPSRRRRRRWTPTRWWSQAQREQGPCGPPAPWAMGRRPWSNMAAPCWSQTWAPWSSTATMRRRKKTSDPWGVSGEISCWGEKGYKIKSLDLSVYLSVLCVIKVLCVMCPSWFVTRPLPPPPPQGTPLPSSPYVLPSWTILTSRTRTRQPSSRRTTTTTSRRSSLATTSSPRTSSPTTGRYHRTETLTLWVTSSTLCMECCKTEKKPHLSESSICNNLSPSLCPAEELGLWGAADAPQCLGSHDGAGDRGAQAALHCQKTAHSGCHGCQEETTAELLNAPPVCPVDFKELRWPHWKAAAVPPDTQLASPWISIPAPSFQTLESLWEFPTK